MMLEFYCPARGEDTGRAEPGARRSEELVQGEVGLLHRPVDDPERAGFWQCTRLVVTPVPRGQLLGVGGTF